MTNDALQDIIENYDNYKNQNLIIDVLISKNITYALYINETQKTLDMSIFYFIKNNNKCIGIVHDLYTDIHAFILEEYRRKNIIFDALKNVILPHIKFRRKKENSVEKICASAFTKASFLLMNKLGFIMETTDLISSTTCADEIVPIDGYILLNDIQEKSWDKEDLPLLNDFESLRKHIKYSLYEAKNKLELVNNIFKFLDLSNNFFDESIHLAIDSTKETRIEAEMLFDDRYLNNIFNE